MGTRKAKLALYNGEVEIQFDPKKHRYMVLDNAEFDPQWLKKPSVTTILGVSDKSKALVPWAVKLAVEVFKEHVTPGKALDEVQIARCAEKMIGARWDVSKRAAGIGTVTHDWLQQYIEGWMTFGEKPALDLPINPEAANCVMAALKWMDEVEFTPVISEQMVYSRQYGYIGTLDLGGIFKIAGHEAICDWKSSKGLYSEYRFQVAAYKHAHEEESGKRGYERYLIRLGKEDGEFEALHLPADEYERDLAAFTGLIPAYHRLTELDLQWREANKKDS
jgi:hypothetical protein